MFKKDNKNSGQRKSKCLAKRERRYFFAFTGIALIGFLIFYVYPIGRTFYLSLTNTRIGSSGTEFVGLGNYIDVLTKDKLFLKAVKQSLIYALTTGPLILLLALLTALLLNAKIRARGVFRTIFFIPCIIPTFAVAAAFKGLFHPSSGVVNMILDYFGIEGPGWYMSSKTALLTLVIVSAWGFGVKMIIFLAGLQEVPESLYEVARLDGAGRFQQFWHVTFPEISHVFFFNVVMTTIDCFKSFNIAYFMGNGEGYPANSTLLFPIYLYNTAFKTPFKLGYASTLSWLFFMIILGFTVINFGLKKFYVSDDGE
ncbi:sugar ABC transporter permease [Diplocloster hominis]|uniref:carbohydrate ABC transporter permease n=1 Tax=Diplocloster hominis TaxID=3079010 RepID=UPI0031BA1098